MLLSKLVNNLGLEIKNEEHLKLDNGEDLEMLTFNFNDDEYKLSTTIDVSKKRFYLITKGVKEKVIFLSYHKSALYRKLKGLK